MDSNFDEITLRNKMRSLNKIINQKEPQDKQKTLSDLKTQDKIKNIEIYDISSQIKIISEEQTEKYEKTSDSKKHQEQQEKNQLQKNQSNEDCEQEIMDIKMDKRYEKSHLYKLKLDLQIIQNQLHPYKFRILKYINSGGEADIFKVIDENNKFKAIRIFSKNQDKLQDEFDRVQKIQGYIFMVTYYQFIKLEKVCVIVMDFFDGNLNDFTQKIKQGEIQFDEADLVSFLGNLSIGLTILQSHKLIHSDIKLRNILYDLSSLTFFYSDFGASIQLNQDQNEGELQQYTVGYMPQHTIDSNKVTYKDDLQCCYQTFENFLLEIDTKKYKLDYKNILSELKQNEIPCQQIPQILIIKCLQEKSLLTKQNILKVAYRVINIYSNVRKQHTNKFMLQLQHFLLFTNLLLSLLLKDSNLTIYFSQKQNLDEIDLLVIIKQLKEVDKMVGVLLTKLGSICNLIGQTKKEGLPYQLKAFEIAQQYPDDKPYLIYTLYSILMSYKSLNDSQNLKKYFDLIMEILNEQPPTEDIISSGYLNDWLNEYFEQYIEIEELQFEEMALTIYQQFFETDNEVTASYHFSVGWYYCSLKDYKISLFHYKKSLDIRQRLGQSDSISICYTYFNIGFIYYKQIEYQEAFKNFEQSKQIFSKLKLEDNRVINRIQQYQENIKQYE